MGTGGGGGGLAHRRGGTPCARHRAGAGPRTRSWPGTGQCRRPDQPSGWPQDRELATRRARLDPEAASNHYLVSGPALPAPCRGGRDAGVDLVPVARSVPALLPGPGWAVVACVLVATPGPIPTVVALAAPRRPRPGRADVVMTMARARGGLCLPRQRRGGDEPSHEQGSHGGGQHGRQLKAETHVLPLPAWPNDPRGDTGGPRSGRCVLGRTLGQDSLKHNLRRFPADPAEPVAACRPASSPAQRSRDARSANTASPW